MVAQMKFLFILLSTCLLHRGVFGVEEITVSVMEGDSVILHSNNKTHQKFRLRWFFNDIRISQINGDVSMTCTDVQCDERFRDRLEMDNKTGSLTITRIITSDAGLYTLKILGNHSSEKIFNVTVHDQKKPEKAKERESVTLYTHANPDALITWCFNDIFIAEISGHSDKVCTDVQCKDVDETFGDRLKLDNETGSLTITNTKTTDSGIYTLKITSSNTTSIIRNFSIAIFDSHVGTPAWDQMLYDIKTVFVVAVLLALSVGGVAVTAVCFCHTVNRRGDLEKVNTNLL